MVKISRMHDPRVMICDGVLVVIIIRIRLQGIAQQSTAVKRCAQPSRDGAHFDIGAEDKGAGAAAEDVGGGGFGEGAAGAGEGQLVVLGRAGDGAPLGLGVNGEGLGGVFGVDLVDVGLVVAGEEAVVEDDAVVWAQGAESVAVGALDQLAPPGAVLSGLGTQPVADGLEAVGGHARDVLRGAGGVGEGQGDGQGDEVNIADVGKELGTVEGKFAEAEIGVEVGVGGVGDGGLDETGAGVEEEG